MVAILVPNKDEHFNVSAEVEIQNVKIIKPKVIFFFTELLCS